MNRFAALQETSFLLYIIIHVHFYRIQKNSIYLKWKSTVFTVTFDQFNASLLKKKILPLNRNCSIYSDEIH